MYSQTGESLNLRNKTSKSTLYGQCLKVPGTTTFKKRFPKLEYKRKAVSVTMIAKNEKM